jgi:hypothetical protein
MQCKPALPGHAVNDSTVHQVRFSGGITFNKWAGPGIQPKTKERGGGISNLSTEITTVLSSAGAKLWCFFVEA